MSIRRINGVSEVTGRPESVRGGKRSLMQAQVVPAVSNHIAGLVDLFRSHLQRATNNSMPTNSSMASLLSECY